MKWPAIGVRHKRVGVDRLSLVNRNNQVDIARPRAFGIEARSLRRMVGMGVVVADDVEAGRVCLALDANVVARVDLISILGSLDDDVASSLGFRRPPVPTRPDQHPTDFVGIALGAMCLDGFESRAADLHAFAP